MIPLLKKKEKQFLKSTFISNNNNIYMMIRIDKLTNSRFDCDLELKSHIDEYNNFKKTFEDQCVRKR